MSYVVIGDKIIQSEDLLKKIEENFDFKNIKDMTRGAKRDDTLIFQIVQDTLILKEELDLEGQGIVGDQEELIEELMNFADEKVSFLEEIMPENTICYTYSYRYDEGSGEIKTIFIVADEQIGELRLRDVAERILRSVD